MPSLRKDQVREQEQIIAFNNKKDQKKDGIYEINIINIINFAKSLRKYIKN